MYLDQQSEILYNLFLLYVQVEDNQNRLKLMYWQLGFTSFKAFKKNKKRSATSLPASFFAWYLKKKYFSRYILLTDQI